MFLTRKLRTAAALRSGLAFLMLVGVAGVVSAPGPPGQMTRARRRHRRRQDEKGTLEIYGFGQADVIADFKQNNPDWYDVNRARRGCRTSRIEFGNDGRFYIERAPEPLRRPRRIADRQRAGEGAVRVRHVRRWRRRRADHHPPAPRVGPVRTVRRRPDQQPVHGRGRLPERRSTTGDRTGCCSSGTSRCSTRSTTAVERARSPSRPRARAATAACSPIASNCRTSSRDSRLPDFTGHYRLGGKNGATSSSAASSARSPTTTSSPTTGST